MKVEQVVELCLEFVQSISPTNSQVGFSSYGEWTQEDKIKERSRLFVGTLGAWSASGFLLVCLFGIHFSV